MRTLTQSLNAGAVDEVVAAGTGNLNVVMISKMTQMDAILVKVLKGRETVRKEIVMAVEGENDAVVDEVVEVIGHHRANARNHRKGSRITAREPNLLKGVIEVIFPRGIPLFPMLLIRM